MSALALGCAPVQQPKFATHQICGTTAPFDLRCESVACNSYNMGMSALPDMQARGHTYQAKHECPCYNYYITLP